MSEGPTRGCECLRNSVQWCPLPFLRRHALPVVALTLLAACGSAVAAPQRSVVTVSTLGGVGVLPANVEATAAPPPSSATASSTRPSTTEATTTSSIPSSTSSIPSSTTTTMADQAALVAVAGGAAVPETDPAATSVPAEAVAPAPPSDPPVGRAPAATRS